jgi:ABC-type lipoprotein release transport system permease subunit
LAVSLLIALLGGAVIAAAAGAHRTERVYPRLLAQSAAPDLLISPDTADGADEVYAAIRARPDVAALGGLAGIPAFPLQGASTAISDAFFLGGGLVAPTDTELGRSIYRPRVLNGRMPAVDATDEVLLSARSAARTHLRVGDRLDLVVLQHLLEGPQRQLSPEDGRPLSVRVVGIGVFPDEVVPFTNFNDQGFVFGTFAMTRLAPRANYNFEGVYARLVPGADPAPVMAAAQAGGMYVDDQSQSAQDVIRGLRPLHVALWLLAGLLAAVVTVVVGQALTRGARLDSATREVLATLGMTQRQVLAGAMVRTAAIASFGAVGAVAVAVAASAIFPVGPARAAEPAGHLHVDLVPLALGAGILVAACELAALPAGLRRERKRPAPPARGLGISRRGWRLGLPAGTVEGLRWATSRRPGSREPWGTTVTAVALAGACAVGAATFGASLDDFLDHPVRYGQTWDRIIDAGFGPVSGALVTQVKELPSARAVAVGRYGDLTVNGTSIPAISLRAVKGDLSIGLLRGAPADDANEIVLGQASARALRVRIGDTVQVAARDEVAGRDAAPAAFTVTGIGIFPRLGQGGFSTTGLGEGAQVAIGLPSAVALEDSVDLPPEVYIDGGLYPFAVIDAAGRPDSLDADLDRLMNTDEFAEQYLRAGDLPPGRVQDLRRVRDIPYVAAGLLALVALAALAHLVIAVARERRGELRLLRALGMGRRQLRQAVRAHAIIVVTLATALALPVGIVAGRLAWRVLATDLDVAVHAITPALTLGALVAGIGIGASLVATPSAWRAARAADRQVREDE